MPRGMGVSALGLSALGGREVSAQEGVCPGEGGVYPGEGGVYPGGCLPGGGGLPDTPCGQND